MKLIVMINHSNLKFTFPLINCLNDFLIPLKWFINLILTSTVSNEKVTVESPNVCNLKKKHLPDKGIKGKEAAVPRFFKVPS